MMATPEGRARLEVYEERVDQAIADRIEASDAPAEVPQPRPEPAGPPVRKVRNEVHAPASAELIPREGNPESGSPDLGDEDISYRPSREGKYLAVNVIITAHSLEQIQALFDDLKASGRVAMVL